MVSEDFICFLTNGWNVKSITNCVHISFQFNVRGRKLHRKELYTSLSLIFAAFLFGILVNDFVSIIDVEMPENSTHEFTFSVLVSMK